ncbi:MAG: LacI family transcriptional regulator [Actinobacteria bacterium]|nr:LacI family transcriptional regulator [Actinomycetota bacterium]
MGKSKQATMKDVAKLAGVSQPTVSHFINGTAPVSHTVAEKMQKAIKELGYMPNALARNLKQERTNTIGLIIPDIDNGYYTEITKNVEKNLREHGFITFLCNTFYDERLEKLYINSLIQQKVAGIVIGYGLIGKKAYEDVCKFEIPAILMDDKVEDDELNIPSVEVNNFTGSKLAVEHLYNIGAKKICYASEPLFNRTSNLRFEGFKKAMKEFGYGENDSFICIENNQYNKIEMGYNIGAQILLNNNIDAVFASSDQLAFGIIQRLKEHNVSIPDEIAIVGYDDIQLSKLVTPMLTTVSQPKYFMAKKGVEILLKMINGEPLTKKLFLLEPSLIIRESTMMKVERSTGSNPNNKN